MDWLNFGGTLMGPFFDFLPDWYYLLILTGPGPDAPTRATVLFSSSIKVACFSFAALSIWA